MIDYIKFKTTESLDWKSNPELKIDNRPYEDYYIGHIKNMAVRQSRYGVQCYGSIAKYLNGENITPLNRQQVQESLERLENDLQLDLSKATLQTLEIGTCIALKNPVCCYQPLFAYLNDSRYKRAKYGTGKGIETVEYSTPYGGFDFKVYDKIREMKNKRIPKLYENTNVLRLELRIKNSQALKEIFGRDIKPFELASPEIYQELKKLFRIFYGKIPKTGKSICLNIRENLTPKAFRDVLAELYRQEHPNVYSNLLQQGREKGFISDKSLERIKAEKGRFRGVLEKNDLVVEIDEKLRLRGL